MYFKRLEMQGFKSFVEPVTIDFNPGVTCVVGPNGSGKSNLSDAIRWVLGEQSAKTIRASKMEDIIFSGTATRKPRGMAEVTLVIDNEEGILPIDYSEVSITRRLYRSGESEYLINNNPCRLKDIKELIMDTGIGVDGYSIISQGKITELVESKPEARRQVFEEAAGVVMYKTKKQESERKLENTELNLDRVNDIIGEIEGRIGSLKEESIKAKEFIELRDKRRDLEINITLRNIEKFVESNETGERDVRELANSIENKKFEKNQVEIAIDEKRDKLDTLDKLGKEKRDDLLSKVQEINDITSQSKIDSEKLSGIEKDINRVENEISDLNNKLDIELNKSNEKENERNDQDKKVLDASNELTDAIDKYNLAVTKNVEIQGTIDGEKSEILSLSKKAFDKRGDAKSYEQYKESLITQKNNLLKEEKEEVEAGKDLEGTLNKLNNELSDNAKEIEDNNNKKLDKIKEQNGIALNLKDAKVKCEDAKLSLGKVQSRKKTIEEMEANYEGYNNAVRFLMKQNIPGIYGVVAELIKSPIGYEIAIETALSGAIQNIVCDYDKDAKKAINILKENSAGRLTFLPIESVHGNVISINPAIERSRGYLGIASNIVEYDKKFDGIIKYILGRTIIVSDMDTAISLSKIEKNGIRFVTLEGEVINSTGAITGGKYKNQTANILSRRNEIDKLDSDIIKISNEIEKYGIEISNYELKNNTLLNELSDISKKESELKIVEANINARINSLKESQNDSIKQKEKRERDLKNLDSDYKSAINLIENANREADSFDLRIKELTADIDLNNVLLNETKDKVKEANEFVTEKRIKKNTLEKEKEKIESLLQVVLDAIDSYTEQIDSKNDELNDLNHKKNQMLYGSNDKSIDIDKLIDEKNELDEKIKDIDQENSKINDEVADLTKKLNVLSSDIDDMIGRKQDYEIKLAKNETQLDIQKQKLLDEFEITYAKALELKRDDFVYSTAVKEAREMRIRMDELGDVNVGSISEYEQVSERYNFLTGQRDDILKAKSELEEIINNIDKTIKVKFKDNFDKVAINFEKTFKELFAGGEAELTLVNENNPLESGIDINVQPPGKKIQNIDAFSGGEKTMIGLALMLAVLKTKPTPFCILDEVEAALDDANIDKFAGSLRGFNETQFAVITHQKATMEHADVLYGVTMPERGISKVLSLRLGDEFDLGDN